MKSLFSKNRSKKSVVKCCPKCGTVESNDFETEHRYYYGEYFRGRDFDDGYKVYASGWYCTKCERYDWLIPDDNEWLLMEDNIDVVLPDVWERYHTKRKAEAKAARAKEMLEYESELSDALKTVDNAIKVFTDDEPFVVGDLVNAGKVLIKELEERKSYTIHILQKQAAWVGLNNQDRRLLR